MTKLNAGSEVDIVPKDSRYIPFTQQHSCCAPTCIQMVMYKNKIPLLPAEEIGYYMGLTLPPDAGHLFYNVRTSDSPPTSAGYGTQIGTKGFTLDEAFSNLKIPLRSDLELADSIVDEGYLLKRLKEIESNNEDALICLNSSVLIGEYRPNSGHLVVFDRIANDKVRIIDPNPNQPKWRQIDIAVLFKSIKIHGNERSGGIWNIKLI
jgi:hypothetical protein